MAARKPTPVDVIYFPKRAKGASAPQRTVTLTQTIPELSLPEYEPPTPVNVDPAPKGGVDVGVSGRKKPRRTRTFSDERAVPVLETKKRPAKDDDDDVRTELNRAGGDDNALSDMAALGHELFSLGKVNEAKVVFEGIVIADPDDAFAHTMLGTIHLSKNDLEAALVSFEKALAADPGDVAARVYRGEIRLNKRRLKGAIDDFTQALRLADAGDPFSERAKRLLKLARRQQAAH